MAAWASERGALATQAQTLTRERDSLRAEGPAPLGTPLAPASGSVQPIVQLHWI